MSDLPARRREGRDQGFLLEGSFGFGVIPLSPSAVALAMVLRASAGTDRPEREWRVWEPYAGAKVI